MHQIQLKEESCPKPDLKTAEWEDKLKAEWESGAGTGRQWVCSEVQIHWAEVWSVVQAEVGSEQKQTRVIWKQAKWKPGQ